MASSVVETHFKPAHTSLGVITLAVTAHTDGTVTDVALATKFNGRLRILETDPGATAPTANYDIAITDAQGFDVLQAVGANRHTSATEKASIVFSATSIHPLVSESDVLTLAITNNSVNGALITIKLYYEAI